MSWMDEVSKFVSKESELYARKTVDDSIRCNARNASGAGLDVRVTRVYDGVGVHDGEDICEWCLERCGDDMPYQAALSKGAFQRHPGCGCVIEYTSAKGAKSVQTGMYNGWNFADELEKRRSIGLNDDFHVNELLSRVGPYIGIDDNDLIEGAFNNGDYRDTFAHAASRTKPELEKDIRGHIKATEEHAWKIKRPELYMKREDPNDPTARAHAVSHWEGDRQRNARIVRIEIEVWRRKYGGGLQARLNN